MTEFNLRSQLRTGRLDLRVVNSLTKYPSIRTYHKLTGKGLLVEPGETPLGDPEMPPPPALSLAGEVTVTEKINGTSARLIVFPDGEVIVGSREELLYAAGDVVPNPQLGIVEALYPRYTRGASEKLRGFDAIHVVYGEVYGWGVAGGEAYLERDAVKFSNTKVTGFRAFDACVIPLEHLLLTPERAAAWRQRGGQDFCDDVILDAYCQHLGMERVPVLCRVHAGNLPLKITDCADWLATVTPRTLASLGVERTDGDSEGVVLRGRDTSGNRLLAKLRYEDVQRTLRARVSDGAIGGKRK